MIHRRRDSCQPIIESLRARFFVRLSSTSPRRIRRRRRRQRQSAKMSIDFSRGSLRRSLRMELSRHGSGEGGPRGHCSLQGRDGG